MRKLGLLLCAPLILLRGQSTGADAFTARITAQIEVRNPRAARIFVSANDARERRDWKEAERLYAEVHRLEPQFSHATRRLCGVLLEQGRKDEAVAFCREVLQIEKTPENRAALINAIIRETGSAKPSPEQVREAGGLAWELLNERVLESYGLVAVCLAAAAGHDRDLLRRGVQRLRESEPQLCPHSLFCLAACGQ